MHIIKIICLFALTLSAAYAEELCGTQAPKTCVTVNKTADKSIAGSFYYTCPMTINNTVHQERLPGNCKNEETCATLESFYSAKLNSMHALPTKAGGNCDTH